ncbi:MAG TPA: sulfurtransferase TusA family protein [Dongiaceae bacterium]|jgi:tRNA 2-thiouridine synthesizing protein A|nr:sulfurtransferase TusA family protein [Dongiaceae bacterium]
MDYELDARGLVCPLPVLKARKKLKELAPGDILTVRATDPGAPGDFRHFCEATGAELLDIDTDASGTIVLRLKV